MKTIIFKPIILQDLCNYLYFVPNKQHAFKNALITGERMMRWGFKGETNCVFCRNGLEDRNHLFFYWVSVNVYREIRWQSAILLIHLFSRMKFFLWKFSIGWRRLSLLLFAGWSWEPPFTTYGGPVMKLDMMGFLILKTRFCNVSSLMCELGSWVRGSLSLLMEIFSCAVIREFCLVCWFEGWLLVFIFFVF